MELALCHFWRLEFWGGSWVSGKFVVTRLIGPCVLFSYHHIIAYNGNMSDICVSCLHSLCSSPWIPIIIQTLNARLPWDVRLRYTLRYHKLSGTAFSPFWSSSLLGFQRLTDVWMCVLSELKSRWAESGTDDIASSTTWFQDDILLRVRIIGLKKLWVRRRWTRYFCSLHPLCDVKNGTVLTSQMSCFTEFMKQCKKYIMESNLIKCGFMRMNGNEIFKISAHVAWILWRLKFV